MLNWPARRLSGKCAPGTLLWRRTSLVLGALIALTAPVSAAEINSGRYTMSPTDGGVVRLDRETGAMAFCTGQDGAWSCKDMNEDEGELKKRVDELEAENRALRAGARRPPGASGLSHPPGAAPPAPGDTVPPVPPGDLPVPTERDVDKLFDYVEGMVKKFKERIDRLEKEAQKDPNADIPL